MGCELRDCKGRSHCLTMMFRSVLKVSCCYRIVVVSIADNHEDSRRQMAFAGGKLQQEAREERKCARRSATKWKCKCLNKRNCLWGEGSMPELVLR